MTSKKQAPHKQGNTMAGQLCVVVASNDPVTLERNLLASDMIARQGVPVHVEQKAPSASAAYNAGLNATSAPIVIFAHQDVYFPPGWEKRLAAQIAAVEALDPNWALLAPFGIRDKGRHIGRVWSTSPSAVVGDPVEVPHPAQSFDELVIVLRRACGLRFDEKLPCFHLYGTDIVQTARAQGLGAYVCDLPLVHNDGFHDKLRNDFARPYNYIRRKWRDRLPIRTPVLWVTRSGLDLSRTLSLLRCRCRARRTSRASL